MLTLPRFYFKEKSFYVSQAKEWHQRPLSMIFQRDVDMSLRMRIDRFTKKSACAEVPSPFRQDDSPQKNSQRKVAKAKPALGPLARLEAEEVRAIFEKERQRQKKLDDKIKKHQRLVEEERY